MAEVAGEYLKKGRPVYIEGRLQTRRYTDKDGVERYATEVIATEMQLLGGRDGGGNEATSAPLRSAPAPGSEVMAPVVRPPVKQPIASPAVEGDDIPF